MYLITSTSLNSSYFVINTFGFLFILIAGQSIQPNWSIGSNQSAHWVYFEHKLSTTSKREKNNKRHPQRWSTNSVQGIWCSERIHIKEPEKGKLLFSIARKRARRGKKIVRARGVSLQRQVLFRELFESNSNSERNHVGPRFGWILDRIQIASTYWTN